MVVVVLLKKVVMYYMIVCRSNHPVISKVKVTVKGQWSINVIHPYLSKQWHSCCSYIILVITA